MERTIGILGGMGPEATAHFFMRLVQLHPANCDQDHPRIVIVNDTKIPDRTTFLKGLGPSPVPKLIAAAQNLERMGADLIAIPCNTAHVFFNEIESSVSIPVLHIVTETVNTISEQATAGEAPQQGSSIGILATEATLDLKLYQKGLEARGFQPIRPDPETQRLVTSSIHNLKGPRRRDEAGAKLSQAVRALHSQGASAVILGCTELGLATIEPILPAFDSLEILAASTLREADTSGVQEPVRVVGHSHAPRPTNT